MLIDNVNKQSNVSPAMKQKLFQISRRRLLLISKRKLNCIESLPCFCLFIAWMQWMKPFSLYNPKLILFDLLVFFLPLQTLCQYSLFQQHPLTQAFIQDICRNITPYSCITYVSRLKTESILIFFDQSTNILGPYHILVKFSLFSSKINLYSYLVLMI